MWFDAAPPPLASRNPDGCVYLGSFSKVLAAGLRLVPGEAFFAGEAGSRCMRLSFVTASVQQIDAGIAALAAIIREQLAQG